jgi:predicted RNA binding protein YcfA (HicA-like mRNA interferase family)
MKAQELIRCLEKDGWFEVRQRGSHKIFRHATKKEIVVVPFHKGRDLATGLVKSIMKNAGIRCIVFFIFLLSPS